MNNTAATFADAITRWHDACRYLPADVMDQVSRAWDEAESLRGDPRLPWEAALMSLCNELLVAGRKHPGDSHYWQHPILLVARCVRAARLLGDRARAEKPEDGVKV